MEIKQDDKKMTKKTGNLKVKDKNSELAPFFEYAKLKRANFEMIALKTKFSNEQLLLYFDVSAEEMDTFCYKTYKKSFDAVMNYMRALRLGRYSLLNDERIKVDGVVAKEFFKGEGIIEEQKQGAVVENVFIIGSVRPTEVLNPKKGKEKEKDDKDEGK